MTGPKPIARLWDNSGPRAGLAVFALALFGFGLENVICARLSVHLLGGPAPRWPVIPVLPWLPASPLLSWIAGALLAACGASLLARPRRPVAARVAAALLAVCAVVFDLPRYAALPASMGLRTLLFEPLAIAAIAWLVAGDPRLRHTGRSLLALSLLVFGAGHFISVASTGVNRLIFSSVMPSWLPWPLFWVGFFGAVFVVCAISLGFEILPRWGGFGLGLMFAIWVFTLHLPRVVAAPHNPDEWSSMLIAVALWGGGWSLALPTSRPTSLQSGVSRARSGS